MELSEKIQMLRKERGLTQEQFAEQLFVSRTAVSKWETGRGMPSMESLKMIAELYGITLDELLRAEEVIAVAANENREAINHFEARTEGFCNIAALLGLFLPLYRVELEQIYYSVPLYQYKGWLAILYWIFPLATAMLGVAQIGINRDEREKVREIISILGMVLNAAGILLMILSGQPYPAAIYFVLFLLKIAVKRRIKN